MILIEQIITDCIYTNYYLLLLCIVYTHCYILMVFQYKKNEYFLA